MDNFTPAERKRRQLIVEIQNLHNAGESISNIVRITGKNWNTVKKYLDGDPDILCRSTGHSSLWNYTDLIIKAIENGQTASSIAKQIKENGYPCTSTNIRSYIKSIAEKYGLEISKYCNTAPRYDSAGEKKPKADYLTRKGIFNYLWMNGELTESHYKYLWEKYNVLPELETCIRQFREIFEKKNMPYLYLFIERYQKSSIKEIASFANGLLNDIYAVENAVASPLSNGFVEGTNSKVKTIKKAMYGRCGKLLLEAKLMYAKSS